LNYLKHNIFTIFIQLGIHIKVHYIPGYHTRDLRK